MKDVVFYGGDDLIRTLSTFTLILPVLAIAFKRSMWHPTMVALLIYYIQFFFFSLITNGFVDIPGADESLVSFSHIIFDLPLVLLFMQYFTDDASVKTNIRYGLLAWVAMGILITAVNGLSGRTITLLMGPGLLLADIISMAFFVKYIKAGIRHKSETGKAFMAGSLVFLYGSYSLMFFIEYVLHAARDVEIYFLFQVSTIVSSLLMTIGILLNRKPPAPVSVEKKNRTTAQQNWEDFQFK
jgi:hypothetical protein